MDETRILGRRRTRPTHMPPVGPLREAGGDAHRPRPAQLVKGVNGRGIVGILRRIFTTYNVKRYSKINGNFRYETFSSLFGINLVSAFFLENGFIQDDLLIIFMNAINITHIRLQAYIDMQNGEATYE